MAVTSRRRSELIQVTAQSHRSRSEWKVPAGLGLKWFGTSLWRLFEPCAATVFRRQVPFSQVACAVWRGNRLPRLCFRIRHPSEVSACAMMLALRHRETGGTGHFYGPCHLFERLDGGNRMAVFDPRDIATQQSRTIFNVALRE